VQGGSAGVLRGIMAKGNPAPARAGRIENKLLKSLRFLQIFTRRRFFAPAPPVAAGGGPEGCRGAAREHKMSSKLKKF
jgi:hypothetical protein